MRFERNSRDKIKFGTKLTFTPVEYKIMHSFVFISYFRIVFQSCQIEFILFSGTVVKFVLLFFLTKMFFCEFLHKSFVRI